MGMPVFLLSVTFGIDALRSSIVRYCASRKFPWKEKSTWEPALAYGDKEVRYDGGRKSDRFLTNSMKQDHTEPLVQVGCKACR